MAVCALQQDLIVDLLAEDTLRAGLLPLKPPLTFMLPQEWKAQSCTVSRVPAKADTETRILDAVFPLGDDFRRALRWQWASTGREESRTCVDATWSSIVVVVILVT